MRGRLVVATVQQWGLYSSSSMALMVVTKSMIGEEKAMRHKWVIVQGRVSPAGAQTVKPMRRSAFAISRRACLPPIMSPSQCK
jgi:hypothetical protein